MVSEQVTQALVAQKVDDLASRFGRLETRLDKLTLYLIGFGGTVMVSVVLTVAGKTLGL